MQAYLIYVSCVSRPVVLPLGFDGPHSNLVELLADHAASRELRGSLHLHFIPPGHEFR